MSDGKYLDNKKIDTWNYYSSFFDGKIEREITYNADGSIFEKNDLYKYEISIDKDSVLMSGKVFHNGDTILISCSGQKGNFTLNKIEILNFECLNYSKFDYELSNLIDGFYDRRIKEIKTEFKK